MSPFLSTPLMNLMNVSVVTRAMLTRVIKLNTRVTKRLMQLLGLRMRRSRLSFVTEGTVRVRSTSRASFHNTLYKKYNKEMLVGVLFPRPALCKTGCD